MTLENFFQINLVQWPWAVMMLLRIISIMIWLPIFGESAVPTRLKISFALMLAIFLWPSLKHNAVAFAWSPIGLLLLALKEIFLGFSIGFVAKSLLTAASIGSNLIGISMGFQTASMFSMHTGTQESAFAVFKNWIMLLLLISLNVHHFFIEHIARSFSTIPIVISGANGGLLVNVALKSMAMSFVLGVKLVAPVLVVQILLTVSLGLLNRAIPSLNAMVLSFPISFLVSMVVLFLSIAGYAQLVRTTGLQEQYRGINQINTSFERVK